MMRNTPGRIDRGWAVPLAGSPAVLSYDTGGNALVAADARIVCLRAYLAGAAWIPVLKTSVRNQVFKFGLCEGWTLDVACSGVAESVRSSAAFASLWCVLAFFFVLQRLQRARSHAAGRWVYNPWNGRGVFVGERCAACHRLSQRVIVEHRYMWRMPLRAALCTSPYQAKDVPNR